MYLSSEQVPVYMRVTSCYIALYYYMGFALMMMRRYSDAVRNMTGVLMYLYRTQVMVICRWLFPVCVCERERESVCERERESV